MRFYKEVLATSPQETLIFACRRNRSPRFVPSPGGSVVRRYSFLVVSVLFASLNCLAQTLQEDRLVPQPQPHSTEQACNEPSRETVHIPSSLVKRAKLKAHLIDLLRASIFDDAKGVVNTVREKEIRKLVNELRKDQPVPPEQAAVPF